MIDKKEMQQVVERFVADKDLFLVEINIDHSDNIVEVLIDSMDSVTLDDCVAVNDAILSHFDRDKEDFELTVASYGISDPFKVPAHYLKNVGGEVETLTADGRKLKGTLKSADEQGFVLTTTAKVKPEGKKRPEIVEIDNELKYNEIKYTKNIIKF